MMNRVEYTEPSHQLQRLFHVEMTFKDKLWSDIDQGWRHLNTSFIGGSPQGSMMGGGRGKYINVQSFDNFQTSPLGYFNSSKSQVTLLHWWYMGRSNNTILRKLLALDIYNIVAILSQNFSLVGVSKKFMWYWNLIGPLIYFQGNFYKKYQIVML